MKLEEAKLLFEEKVSDLPPKFRQEFTVDNVKRMRDIAKKYGIVINLGSGSSVKRNKVYVGYSYHIFSLHKKGSGGAYGEYTQPSRKEQTSFWNDFIKTFSKSYNITSPIEFGAPDRPITDGQQAKDAVATSNKIRLIHKHVVEDKNVHARKVEAHLNSLLNDVIYNTVNLNDRHWTYDTDDEVKRIRKILASEKTDGYTYPDFEKKLNNRKTWPEQFRKIRLMSHVKKLKEVDSIKSSPYKDEQLQSLIKNLEDDELTHGLAHPELEKNFPKAGRPLIYWQKITNKKKPTHADVMKNILPILKGLTDAYDKKAKLENIKYKISMARQAGIDDPEFATIEKYIKDNRKQLSKDD